MLTPNIYRAPLFVRNAGLLSLSKSWSFVLSDSGFVFMPDRCLQKKSRFLKYSLNSFATDFLLNECSFRKVTSAVTSTKWISCILAVKIIIEAGSYNI